jgi:predicted benzoate:H+ symporter BenE
MRKTAIVSFLVTASVLVLSLLAAASAVWGS